jgi:hypothetical protein
LSYISDGPDYRIQVVLDAGVAPRLVELLSSTTTSFKSPALRTIGNIVTGDDSQTQAILDLNVLPALLWLLNDEKKNIRKEACWTLSNITAGTPEQIQAVIDANIFPKLIELLRSSEFDIQIEAAWAVSSASSFGNPDQIRYLVDLNALEPLCNLLNAHDVKIITVALEGIESILRCADGEGYLEHVVDLIESCDGTESIENLQNHDNTVIYRRVSSMLETYFGAVEVDENDITG